MHHWKYSCALVMLAVLVLLGPGCGQSNPRIGKEKNTSLDVKGSRANYSYSIQADARDKTGSEDADLQSIPPSDHDERRADFNTESYDHIVENSFLGVMQYPQSTFSIDVDTASYSNVRRMLNEGTKPPAGAVRIEEFVNYFSYDYPQPIGEHPFSVTTDLAICPWNDKHQLVRIGLKGKEIANEERGASNLVFLLDVSGSMNESNKLPLVKSAMRLLVESLDDRDYISIVVYAGASGQVLPPTAASRKARILSAINNLEAGGSTNGGEGIELAYRIAERNFIDGGINRVILCTDGDFNVGVSNESDLVDLITEKAASNIFLSVLGFGTGNYKDSMMEKLADKGNGNYAYIDSLLEARKTLVHEMGATLITIAKDVKIQINFNPQRVQAYRLLGYENRMLKNEDFEDDTKDAGEIGAGHSVTAIYEIIPAGIESTFISTTKSDFVETIVKEDADPNILLMVDLRYKSPEGSTSKVFGTSLIHNVNTPIEAASRDFQFATSVAAFGMLLRSSNYAGNANYDWVIETAQASKGVDRDGFRSEFIELAKRARMIAAE